VTRAGVLALQGDVREHATALKAAGADTVVEIRRPEQLADLGALVLPGGESTTVSRLLTEYGLGETIRQRVDDGMAVLGTCAGLILLAGAVDDFPLPVLGLLPVRVRRNAYGRQVDSFETLLDAPALGAEPLPAVFIRAPRIVEAGDGVDILARHRGDPVLCRRGRVLAATFHPELTADRRVHRLLLDAAAGRHG
jgi:5'-phosphate synthase pdxT subunit